jgi:hypothetical protein
MPISDVAPSHTTKRDMRQGEMQVPSSTPGCTMRSADDRSGGQTMMAWHEIQIGFLPELRTASFPA